MYGAAVHRQSVPVDPQQGVNQFLNGIRSDGFSKMDLASGGGYIGLELGSVASDLKLTIHPHPTLSETIMEAAEVFYGQSAHFFQKK